MVSRALPSGGNPRPKGRGIAELNINTNVFFYKLWNVIAAGWYNFPTYGYDNNGDIFAYGWEMDSQYQLNDRWFLYGDYAYITLNDVGIDRRSLFLYEVMQGKNTLISHHTTGAGLRYTNNPWELDFYVKYFSQYQSADFIATEGVQISGYFKPVFRAAYHFQIAKKYDAIAEINVSDFLGGNVYESTSRYERETQAYASITIQF